MGSDWALAASDACSISPSASHENLDASIGDINAFLPPPMLATTPFSKLDSKHPPS
eukprot:CAMPEP_0196793838 /NCGR_PEP_ID=MMETSP1104-20130614/33574_1 /TAXON_ID=33652 /ORGANISM="Cafeteria sp., Strain Caron Lab Isolate" /LENGTH=55 /DNA_ID=CAMNT_0042164211 /DNA_START=88 /DNA_END=255 /DNA_ORIENTATION=-